MVAAASASQLAATIQDFQDCLGLVVSGSKVYGDHCMLQNGSIFIFRNFDEYTKCVGQKADILFLNEAVNLDEKSFGTLVQGIRHSIYLNYNPTRKCWVDKYLNKDKSNLLVTTWKDNPYLPDWQKQEFENIKLRAQSSTATIFDRYAYEVFYLGNFTEMSGKVFTMISTITDDEFDKVPVAPSYGLDFGFVDNKDFTCLIACKFYEGTLYAKQLIASGRLANNKDLAFAINDCGLDCYDTIYCDYAGLGKERIKKIATAGDYQWTEPEIKNGFNLVNAKKGRVIDGLQRMLQCDKICVTESSDVLHLELDRYEITPEGKEASKHQNTVDALRYAFVSAF